jgi:Predicted integral membrane protein (DUF2269)
VVVDSYGVVLYLHLLFLLLGIGAATLIWLCLFRLRAAQTLEEAAPWGMLAGKSERAFPVAMVGLYGTGAYLTSDAWTWDTSWIIVSIVAFAVVALPGPLVAGRRAKLLEHALVANGPGPLGDEARRRTRDPALWIVSFTIPAVVLGIVWNMTQKPGTAGAVAAVLVAYAVGAAVALRLSKAPASEAGAVTEPSG